VLNLLGAPPSRRPRFHEGLGPALRAALDDELAAIGDRLPADGPPLYVGKRLLGLVHGCESRMLAERDEPFAWTVASARGTVAHKAVELSLHWRRSTTALELVDEAIDRLAAGSDGLASFLQHCAEVDRAELRSEANDRVAKFLECFPPLRREWRPVTESRVRVDAAGGRVVLSGRVDLTLGSARGDRAGKVLLDLKTGGFRPADLDDLRFYALLEAIRLGVPPRMIAGYYLDAGTSHTEVVTEGLLDAALARTVDGVQRLADLLLDEADPVLRAGHACRWCPRSSSCSEGIAWLEEWSDAA